MPLNQRRIYGTVYQANSITPLVGGTVVASLESGSFTSSNTFVPSRITATTDNAGYWFMDAWTEDDGSLRSAYRIKFPLDHRWYGFDLPLGDGTPVAVNTLIAAGLAGVDPSATAILTGLIEAHEVANDQHSFLHLTDSPNSYTGQAGKAVVVNNTEDALIFGTGGGGGGSGTLAGDTDVNIATPANADTLQFLTSDSKWHNQAPAQARTNLGLGTAATHDVPASGNATSGQAVLGADTRLTDSRTPTAHATSHVTGGGDVIADAVAGGASGLLSGADKTKLNNTSGTNTGDQTLPTDATIATSDITTNNVSITKHGFAPKAPNDATKYLDGTGAYSVPPGGASSLAGDTDVNIATPANADTLQYLTSDSKWHNQTPAQARTNLGLGTLATQDGTFSGTSSGTNTGDQTVPGFATPAIVLGAAAAAGAASTVVRSDGTIAAFDATVPVTQAYGDAAATGSVAKAARRDHVHGMPAAPTDATIAVSDVTTNNVSSTAHGFAPKSPADATKFLNGATTPAYAQVKDSDLSTSDVTTNNVSSTKHGLAPKSPADATQFLNGATTPAYAQVKDSDLSTSDITTNNASSSKHGLLPKLDAVSTHFLDGTGAWSTPPDTGFANPMTTQDDLIVGGTSGAPGRLGKGSDGQVLTVDPTTHHLLWATPSAASFATPAIVLGSSAAAGAASTVIRSDGTIAAFDATSPSTQAFGDSAVVGTAAFAARRDHKHAMPAIPTGYGTFASKPSAGKAGQLWTPSDGSSQWVDDGSAWRPIVGGVVGTAPPAAASWTQLHFGSGAGLATVVDSGGAVHFTSGLNAGVFAQAITIAPGQSVPYTVIINFSGPVPMNDSGMDYGLGWGDSAAGTWQTWISQNNLWNVINWSNVGGATATSTTTSYSTWVSPLMVPQWWKLQDDNTNRIWWTSWDGVHWQKFLSVARTNFLSTPDRIAFNVDAQGTTFTIGLLIRSFAAYAGLV